MRFSRAITAFSSVAVCGVALQLGAADEPAKAQQQERQEQRQERQTERQTERQERQTERQVERQTDRPARPAERSGERQVVREIQWQGTDQMLATCVAIDNKAEIALAEFGASNTQNDKVKEFAKMLVSDHQQFQQKLQQFAPSIDQVRFTEEAASTSAKANVQQAAGTTRREVQVQQTAGNDADRNRTEREVVEVEARVAMEIDPVQLHRELAAQCLADTKQKLTASKNDDFDESFIGYQIVMHGATISKLKVLQRHSSGELAQILAEGQKTTESHMQKAEQLMKELAAANNSTRREGVTSRD